MTRLSLFHFKLQQGVPNVYKEFGNVELKYGAGRIVQIGQKRENGPFGLYHFC